MKRKQDEIENNVVYSVLNLLIALSTFSQKKFARRQPAPVWKGGGGPFIERVLIVLVN